MKSLSTRQQLVFAFGALLALVLVVSLLALRALGEANLGFSTFVNEDARREQLVSEMRDAVNARAIAARNMVLAPSAAVREAENARVVQAHQVVQASLQKLQASLGVGSGITERDRALVAEIAAVEGRYSLVALAIVKLALEDQRDEAIQRMNAECRPLLDALVKAATDYLNYSAEQTRLHLAAAQSAFAARRLLLGLASLLAAFAAVGLGWLITRRLAAALGAEPADLGRAAERVAEGDLRPVPGADRAPAGSVLASMGRMQAQLVALIGQVHRSADSIATASTQIAQGNLDLSGRTEQQAAALEQTASSMEELGSAVRQNADNARQADQLAQSASVVAVQGGEVVGQVVETMQGITDASRKIADIISVIDGIAFQTNILALNAAVEAARAGEQGRGFAVVASEVRTLAQRSAEAAREIKSLITASVERVEQGRGLVDRAGTTMTAVVDSIQRVTDLMGNISHASAEQSAGVVQVGQAVQQMDQATQQNAALVEESTAAAQSLQAQARQLVQAVSAFKLGAMV